MYVKVDKKNNVLQYPYSLGNLRMDFSNTSFPKDINDETINELGVYKVSPTQRPQHDGAFQRLSDSVELVNESWIQKWIIENASQEEAEIGIRTKRNMLLQETDWMALSDNTLTQEWVDYRQALRDVTDQEGFPFEVEWPAKPSE
jgi:hypothetical protein